MSHTYHPVRSDAELIDIALRSGLPMAEIIGRGTGKSLACALKHISHAMLTPGRPITTFDHYQSLPATRECCKMCRELVAKLGLWGFTFTAETVTYMEGML